LKFKAKNTGIASLYRVFLTKKFSFLFKIGVLFYIDLAINASSEEIVDTHLEIISQVSSIELLDLDVSEITDAGIPFIIPLQNLKALRLKDNPQLTDACIPHLAKLKDLKSIHLGNTSVTIDGLETLCSQLQLEEVILNYRFEDFVSKLKQISKAHPQLSILIKGTGTIKNGEMQ